MWKSQLLIDFNNRLSSWFVCLWAFAPAFCSHLLAWDFTDVLGWVCVGSVRVVKTEGELVAGLSCLFSQRLKQSRDEVAAFLRLLRFEWIYRFTWMMYDHYLQLFQCRSCCLTHTHTPIHCFHTHPCYHTNTHIHTSLSNTETCCYWLIFRV